MVHDTLVGVVQDGSLNGGWSEYGIADASKCGQLPDVPGLPLSAHLGVLGITGLTAYFGLLRVCKKKMPQKNTPRPATHLPPRPISPHLLICCAYPLIVRLATRRFYLLGQVGLPKAGETVLVSGAAGATGSVVCQVAKIKGCKVIGIAGGSSKCQWLSTELGLDGVIDYKAAGGDPKKFQALLRAALKSVSRDACSYRVGWEPQYVATCSPQSPCSAPTTNRAYVTVTPDSYRDPLAGGNPRGRRIFRQCRGYDSE